MRPSSDRMIVGFGLREHPDVVNWLERTKFANIVQHLNRIGKRALSADDGVWPDCAITDGSFPTNPMGLDFLPDTFGIADARVQCLVAFDMNKEDAEFSNDRLGLILIPGHLLYYNKNWMFCGYDVVNIGELFSAMYTFDVSKDELFPEASDVHSMFNDYGLLRDEEDAKILAIRADELVPEHAPFRSIGVWVKAYSRGVSLLGS